MIVREIDWRPPADAFAPLQGVAGAHLLHGGDQSERAEWSVIAAFPAAAIATQNGDHENPFARLDAALVDRKLAADDAWRRLPFVSGALGFAGYEAARFLEPGLMLPSSPFRLPDLWFGLYDAAALFSRIERRAYVAGRDERAVRRLRDALGIDRAAPADAAASGEVTSNFSRGGYQAAVGAAIENILDGDYYQANLSQQLSTTLARGDPFGLFRALAAQSDAFHGALLQFDEGAIISNSPERFFRVEPLVSGDKRIVAEPIKGTRARGVDPAEDAALAQSLLCDPKDRAENIMIADLLRNDLSRICHDGSIREEAVCALMSLTHVHHLVSRISGVLPETIGLGEIFAALFPCGSITGAPKIEAMRAIARIERIGRGPYCGAIGYADDRGGADFAVAIRTIIADGARCVLPVGGGVTLRSDPALEYEETIIKARGALKALGASAASLL